MTTTFRAAYIPAQPSGVATCLTSPEDSNLSDSDLMELARNSLALAGEDPSKHEIVIGDWTE